MKALVAFCGLTLFSTLAVAASDEKKPEQTPSSSAVAEVDGVTLTMADFEAKRPAGLFQARNNFYEAERKAVDEFINEYLISKEARKEGITAEQLLDRHVNAAGFKEPSEETLRVYYEGVDTTEPFEAVRGKILEAIRTRRIARARSSYIQELRGQAKISFLVPPPRASISVDGAPVRGPQGAPVTIVEFADYECPYCQQIQPVVDKLLSDYKGKIGFVFKDFPLPMHSHAEVAAEAAHCAQDQGKYWELHDFLFSSREYEPAKLKDAAHAMNMDADRFKQCLDGGAKASVVKSQFEESQALGLPGTPAFFVNGRLINPNGTVSYATLQQLVDEELAIAAREKQRSGAVTQAQREK